MLLDAYVQNNIDIFIYVFFCIYTIIYVIVITSKVLPEEWMTLADLGYPV